MSISSSTSFHEKAKSSKLATHSSRHTKSSAVKPTPLQRQALLQLVDAQLPQTQCTRCGYSDCLHYAQAIVDGQTQINRCQPGGALGIERLAKVTNQAVLALAPDVGLEAARMLAVVDEKWCIGCTKCMQVCPVDAIVGASKRMHTVIENMCTGCELCISVCPVDCIELIPSCDQSPAPTGWAAWSEGLAKNARERYHIHKNRLAQRQHSSMQAKLATQPDLNALPGQETTIKHHASQLAVPSHSEAHKKELLAQILAKAKARQKNISK